jgi:hypothetical protein
MIRNMVHKIMGKGKFKWRVQCGKEKSFMERLANLNCTKVSAKYDFVVFVVCNFVYSHMLVVFLN